ncbi:hypothetical protein ccbrp13_63570 [Ktedonobacteria bacterium brp13]|nr:hypothetical protein ccbrp13_63570 [Ktedonobacteria bacterium brp13]
MANEIAIGVILTISWRGYEKVDSVYATNKGSCERGHEPGIDESQKSGRYCQLNGNCRGIFSGFKVKVGHEPKFCPKKRALKGLK